MFVVYFLLKIMWQHIREISSNWLVVTLTAYHTVMRYRLIDT